MIHRVTGSATDRVIHCPGSAVLPRIERDTPEARAGTGLHDYLKTASNRGRDEALAEIDDDDLRAACEVVDLDRLPVGAEYAAEVAMAYDVFSGEARELARGKSRAEAYVDVRPTEIAMTLDVIALADDHVAVWDYKRGDALRASKSWQLRTGAVAASRLWGKPAARVSMIRYVGSNPSFSTKWLDAFDLANAADALRELYVRVTAAAADYRNGRPLELAEGDWCKYCEAFNACPAKTAALKRLATGAMVDEMELMLPLSKEMAAVAYGRWRQAKQLLKRVEAALHAFVKVNGPVEVEPGVMWGEVERRGNEVLDGQVAHAVLTEMFGGDTANVASKFEISKTSITRAIKALEDGEPIAPRQRHALEVIAERGGVSRRASTTRCAEYDAPADEAKGAA